MKQSELNGIISGLVAMRENADDKTASQAVECFPTMKYDGSLIAYGTRIRWNGVVMKAAVDLWDTQENNPDNAPNSWAQLDYVDGVRVIKADMLPAVEQFAKNELGWWQGEVYRSKVDGNVYSPSLVPDNWELQLR